jgi:hypothetical protein
MASIANLLDAQFNRNFSRCHSLLLFASTIRQSSFYLREQLSAASIHNVSYLSTPLWTSTKLIGIRSSKKYGFSLASRDSFSFTEKRKPLDKIQWLQYLIQKIF